MHKGGAHSFFRAAREEGGSEPIFLFAIWLRLLFISLNRDRSRICRLLRIALCAYIKLRTPTAADRLTLYPLCADEFAMLHVCASADCQQSVCSASARAEFVLRARRLDPVGARKQGCSCEAPLQATAGACRRNAVRASDCPGRHRGGAQRLLPRSDSVRFTLTNISVLSPCALRLPLHPMPCGEYTGTAGGTTQLDSP